MIRVASPANMAIYYVSELDKPRDEAITQILDTVLGQYKVVQITCEVVKEIIIRCRLRSRSFDPMKTYSKLIFFKVELIIEKKV